LLAAQRKRKGADLLAVTERDLGPSTGGRASAPLRGMPRSAQVGAVLDKHKMGNTMI
jgi:hypothetical protein